MSLVSSAAFQNLQDAESISGRKLTSQEAQAIRHLQRRHWAPHTLNFQQVLETLLNEQKQNGQRTPDNPTLLSVNPHMNLRVMQQAHPGAQLVFEDGNFSLKLPAPQLAQQVAQHPLASQAVQASPTAGQLSLAMGQAYAGHKEEALVSPFGKSVAPSSSSAPWLSGAVSAVTGDLKPDSLQALLAPRWQTLPIASSTQAPQVNPDISHWDKL